jgi:hypothetical protein
VTLSEKNIRAIGSLRSPANTTALTKRPLFSTSEFTTTERKLLSGQIMTSRVICHAVACRPLAVMYSLLSITPETADAASAESRWSL